MPESNQHSLLLTVLDDMGEFVNDLPRHRQGSFGGDLRTAREQSRRLVEQIQAAEQKAADYVSDWQRAVAHGAELEEQLEAAQARIAHLEQSWHDSASMATYTSSVPNPAKRPQ